MAGYSAASYQQDFMNALDSIAEVTFYGPGFPGFSEKHTLDDALSVTGVSPDLILVGHSWLNEGSRSGESASDRIALRDAKAPVVVLLNKEYTQLNQKLGWIEAQRPQLVLTHHHDAAKFQKRTGVSFAFWPFAVDPTLFQPAVSKNIHLGFSGILRNPTFPDDQSDVRLRVQRHFFHHLGPFRGPVRKDMKDIRIWWNSFTGERPVDMIQKVLTPQKRLDQAAYARTLGSAFAWLNGPSPMDLVSPRYFECMASETLVLTPHFSALDRIIPSDHFVDFSSPTELLEKLRFYLSHPSDAQAITNHARETVLGEHTWLHRAEQVLGLLK